MSRLVVVIAAVLWLAAAVVLFTHEKSAPTVRVHCIDGALIHSPGSDAYTCIQLPLGGLKPTTTTRPVT